MITSEYIKQKAIELGLKPIAKFVGFSVAGCDATEMGMGPLYAIPKVLAKTGLTADQMDIIELNEAFASQALACIRELGLNMDKVNPCSLALSGEMLLRHLGWTEAADVLTAGIAKAIADKVVTYDLARLASDATEVSCSGFAKAVVDRM